ncbi:S24 family peptidase [Methylobacterium sp. J-068]|uniref:S24 family peptidase n=1 Tax=Methylobacterium sp. J-068 TaxID=2836649 RepID=UPI001FB946EE|nr:S24 family peptidase [Methylobacterium sp. J-068]MCJ2033168.1 S24 family peptidase [Methylobacterium sp. J-068]
MAGNANSTPVPAAVRPRQVGRVTQAIRNIRGHHPDPADAAIQAIEEGLDLHFANEDREQGPSCASRRRPIRSSFDPNAMKGFYGLKVDGKCLEPIYLDKCILMFDPTEPYRADDYVVIHFKREFLGPNQHQAIVKRVVFAVRPSSGGNIAPCLIVEQLNPQRTFAIAWEHIEAVHKCVGVMPDDRRTNRLTYAEEHAYALAARCGMSRR